MGMVTHSPEDCSDINSTVYTVSDTEPVSSNCPVNGSRCSLVSLLLLVYKGKCQQQF